MPIHVTPTKHRQTPANQHTAERPRHMKTLSHAIMEREIPTIRPGAFAGFFQGGMGVGGGGGGVNIFKSGRKFRNDLAGRRIPPPPPPLCTRLDTPATRPGTKRQSGANATCWSLPDNRHGNQSSG